MKRFCNIFLFLLICAVSNATHNRAGQLTFEHVSGDTYKFTQEHFFWTPSAATIQRTSLAVSWGDGSRPDRIPRVFIEEIADEYTRCLYIAEHTFPGPGVYTIVIEDPNRNAGVDNIPNSVSVFYANKTIFAIDPNFGAPNNSPTFPNYPRDKAAVGRRFVHNPGSGERDAEGDLLTYALDTCLRERGVRIETYRLPETSNELYVDARTGDFVWDAPVKEGIYNVAMRIDEWRNGYKISSIIRDMQIEVVDTDNEPPVIEKLRDTCVIAGALIKIKINAMDPKTEFSNGDRIVLTASGDLINEDKAELTDFEEWFDEEGNSHISAWFVWETTPEDVRSGAYTVTFRAEDRNEDVNLVDYASLNITVIAPKVKNVDAEADKKIIDLVWDESICKHASGYEIWRRIGPVDIELDDCQTGIPAEYNYEMIATVEKRTSYADSNEGSGGLSPGIEYCYRIVAIFEDGAKSKPSCEICATLDAGTPPIIRAHVEKIHETEGEIHVAWLEKPNTGKTGDRTGPFVYHVYYSTDITIIENWRRVHISEPAFAGNNDTLFIHNIHTDNGLEELNTIKIGHFYKIGLWDTDADEYVEDDFEDFEIASTFYPILTPSNNTVIINIGGRTPWITEEYIFFRCESSDGCIPDMLEPMHPQPEPHPNRPGIFVDRDVENGKQYRYRVQSNIYRVVDGIRYGENDEIFNWSHIASATPEDNIPPCTPSRFALLTGESKCEEYHNEIRWEYGDECFIEIDGIQIPKGTEDVEKFIIYFSNEITIEPDKFIEIAEVYRDSPNREGNTYFFRHGMLNGAYYIVAVNSQASGGLQSERSNVLWLFDQCGVSASDFEIPNVFTPNNDFENDWLIAHIPMCICNEDGSTRHLGECGIVSKIDMRIYNRAGKLVFKTDEPCINWDGKDMDGNQTVPTGVYIYTCDIYRYRMGGVEEIVETRAGFIHLYNN